MARLWLVLLLALSLWPSAASASTSAPLPGGDEVHGGAVDYSSDVLRSPVGLGIVWRIENHGRGCSSGCSHRTHRGESGPPQHLSGSDLLLVRARLLLGPGLVHTDDAVPPLCERLPYFATAPPSQR